MSDMSVLWTNEENHADWRQFLGPSIVAFTNLPNNKELVEDNSTAKSTMFRGYVEPSPGPA